MQRRILIVDDDEFVLSLCATLLLDSGHSVEQADTSDQALEMCRSQQFDVVVLDCMMQPGASFTAIETHGGYKTGIALAREIENQQNDCLIIAYTLTEDPEVLEWFDRPPLYRFASKREVAPSELSSLIERELRELEWHNESSKWK